MYVYLKCTWMQSLMRTHERIGTQDVDGTARVSFYLVDQNCQIMDSVLKRKEIILLSQHAQDL